MRALKGAETVRFARPAGSFLNWLKQSVCRHPNIEKDVKHRKNDIGKDGWSSDSYRAELARNVRKSRRKNDSVWSLDECKRMAFSGGGDGIPIVNRTARAYHDRCISCGKEWIREEWEEEKLGYATRTK